MITRLDYNDSSDLAELISTMESAGLPSGHSGSLRIYDAVGNHYATIEINPNGNASLVLSTMEDIQDG